MKHKTENTLHIWKLGFGIYLGFGIWDLGFPCPVRGMEFYTDLVPFLEGVEITYEIPYDQLQFVTDEEGYLTRFNFVVIFEDEKGEIVKSDFWERSFKIKDYEETQLRSESILGEVSIRTPPGSYRLITRVEDLNSSFGGVHHDLIQVSDLRKTTMKGFASSGIKFLKVDEDSLNFHPNPRRSYEEKEGVVFLFEVYDTQRDDIMALWKIEDMTRKVVQQGERRIEKEDWVPLEGINGNPKFFKSRVIVQNKELSKGGEYLLLLEIGKKSEGNDSTSKFIETRSFTLDYSPFVTQESYLDRITLMEYITTPEEMETLKSATPEERKKIYREFWKKHDPTPMTERNEAEEKYFQRVEIANEKFRPPEEGWRSDRGRILIKFGPPDEIREQPFSVATNPYEIWYYYGPNYKFIFSDEHGIGKYALLNREEEMRADQERQ